MYRSENTAISISSLVCFIILMPVSTLSLAVPLGVNAIGRLVSSVELQSSAEAGPSKMYHVLNG